MTFEQLQNLINAGFSRDDLISMGILKTTQAAPASDPAPAPAQDPKPAADPAPEQPAGLSEEDAFAALITELDARLDAIQAADPAPEQPAGLSAEDAFAALITKLDARLDAIQAANINGAGMQSPDQKKTAEQILTELVAPPRKE